MTRRRLRRGAFHSLVDLQAAINRYLAEHNANPKPFVWTATTDKIMAKLTSIVPDYGFLQRCPCPNGMPSDADRNCTP